MHAGAFWVRTLYSDLIRLLPEAVGEWFGPAGRPSRGRDCSRWVGSPGGTGLAVTSLPACVRECEEVRNKPTSAAAQWRSTPRRAWHPQRSVAGQEEDKAVLDLAGLVEERGEGAVPGGDADEAEWGAGVVGDESEQIVFRQIGLRDAGGSDRTDDFPYVGAAREACPRYYEIAGQRPDRRKRWSGLSTVRWRFVWRDGTRAIFACPVEAAFTETSRHS